MCIAMPLYQLSEKLKVKPFMEYSMSYALYNWRRLDKNKPLGLKNFSLIREFEGSKSETGFVAVHVAMVRHTGKFVVCIDEIFKAIRNKDI